MKKTTAVAAILALGISLSACNKDNNPTPLPTTTSPVVEQTTNAPEPTTGAPAEPTRDSEPRPTDTQPEETTKPTPVPSVISSDAGTPANQFAARWGKQYPDVPEYVILKTANRVCEIMEGNANWDDPVGLLQIATELSNANISGTDAMSFALDARQDYCSSVANPT